MQLASIAGGLIETKIGSQHGIESAQLSMKLHAEHASSVIGLAAIQHCEQHLNTELLSRQRTKQA
jgi:hypothetical protein